MYRSALFSLLFLLFQQIVSAQVGSPRNNWVAGFNGGVGFNKVLFTPNIRQTYFNAPTAGITARYTSEKYFDLLCAIQMEINYARLGWKEDIHSSSNVKLPDTYERRIDYLQVPMLASLGLGKEERGLKGFLLAGPQIGFALKEYELRSSVLTTKELLGQIVPDRGNNVYAQYGKPLDRRVDYGIVGGLGVELTTGLGHFLLDIRYYYGLADFFNNAKKDPFSRSAHNSLVCKFSYLIDLNRRSKK